MTEIAFLTRGGRGCHTEGIFPGRGTIYLWEIVHWTREDACGMTVLIRICYKKTPVPTWCWPLRKSSISVVISMSGWAPDNNENTLNLRRLLFADQKICSIFPSIGIEAYRRFCLVIFVVISMPAGRSIMTEIGTFLVTAKCPEEAQSSQRILMLDRENR